MFTAFIITSPGLYEKDDTLRSMTDHEIYLFHKQNTLRIVSFPPYFVMCLRHPFIPMQCRETMPLLPIQVVFQRHTRPCRLPYTRTTAGRIWTVLLQVVAVQEVEAIRT